MAGNVKSCCLLTVDGKKCKIHHCLINASPMIQTGVRAITIYQRNIGSRLWYVHVWKNLSKLVRKKCDKSLQTIKLSWVWLRIRVPIFTREALENQYKTSNQERKIKRKKFAQRKKSKQKERNIKRSNEHKRRKKREAVIRVFEVRTWWQADGQTNWGKEVKTKWYSIGQTVFSPDDRDILFLTLKLSNTCTDMR